VTRNDDVADSLEEFADLLAAKDVEYKPRAYRRAADNVRAHPAGVEALAAEDAIQEIDGVGEAIADKIEKYLDTGAIEELNDLREEYPVDMDALTAVAGVGPKTVGTLFEALGVRTLDDLERAAEEGAIRDISGFGAKTEENILANIPLARQAQERQLLGEARPYGESVVAYLAEQQPVEEVSLAGSLRRWRPTIGDVDALVASERPQAAVDAFTDWPEADTFIEAGDTKASVRAGGIRVDLRVVVPAEWGSALQYFTGSKEHNITFRNRAIREDLKVNEYGTFDAADLDGDEADDQRAGERIAGETEASMYAALDLPLIPPEMREDRGEIEASANDDLPALIQPGDVSGDLHTHTEWSDGRLPIREHVEAAAAFGHEYVCIADHATGPGMIGGVGLDDDELREPLDEIRRVASEADVTVFAGVEANVGVDGEISVADDVLADLDCVVASPHAGLDGDGTERLVRAVENPHVDVIGHPTGRMINQRGGLDVDVERLAGVAAEEGVALEINANPARLDLSGAAAKTAIEAGATLVIDTDAHSPAAFEQMRYGVHTARRGWAEPGDVLNTRDAEGVRSFLDG